MKTFMDSVKRFLVSEDGPTAVEYAVMLALIIVVCAATITNLGNAAKDKFNSVNSTLSGSGGSGN
ncbi:MAG: Flp family type IVb pilin [Planctomycetota bacterium]|nr:MAG: Flp family type IVb pilin [Planctomycetota bacterium]